MLGDSYIAGCNKRGKKGKKCRHFLKKTHFWRNHLIILKKTLKKAAVILKTSLLHNPIHNRRNYIKNNLNK